MDECDLYLCIQWQSLKKNLPRIRLAMICCHQYLETVSFWVACNHGFGDPQIDTQPWLRWMRLLRLSPLL